MIHRPVYAGEGGIRLLRLDPRLWPAVVSWLVGAVPTGRGGVMPAASRPAPPDGLAVSDGPSGCVAWDAACGQPVAAIDASGEVWVSDGVIDDPAVREALESRGYRRGEMRMTRRVVAPDNGTVAMLRATQWTTAAVRATVGGPAGTVWK